VAGIRKRFEDKVFPDPNSGCWLWGGAVGTHGYGVIGLGKKSTVTAHRLAWMLEHGDIPEGMFVLHKCDNRPCCNPRHLYVGSVKDNSADMMSRRGPTGFKPGHKHHQDPSFKAKLLQNLKRGSRHPRPMSRLSESTVMEIFNATGTQRQIASRYGVCQQQVSKIKLKKIRSYLHAHS